MLNFSFLSEPVLLSGYSGENWQKAGADSQHFSLSRTHTPTHTHTHTNRHRHRHTPQKTSVHLLCDCRALLHGHQQHISHGGRKPCSSPLPSFLPFTLLAF